MPNIGALWAEMREGGLRGGVQAVFVAKIIKYQGTFGRKVGGCLL